MSGLDNIINHIETSATTTASEMLEKAKADAEAIIASGKAKADENAAAIDKQGAADAQAARKRIESRADQSLKRYILQAKQWEIDRTIAAALDKIQAMPDAAYFETILKMVDKYAPDHDGVIRFSGEDLERMPKGFEARINETLAGRAKLTLSKEAVNINGGFVLEYGDIEENCSLDALAESSKEELQDKISQILFD
mgnify:CR=1 FL=1